jgi:hypothetical protein
MRYCASKDEILRKQRKGYTLGRIQECLLDLDGVGLIILYGDERGQYLQLTRHGEEQKINRNREAKSKIPAPLTEDSGVIQSNRVKLSKDKLSKDKDNTPLISPPKKRFLDNVLLTTEEHTKLVERFSAKTTAQWIEKLDSYIGSKGRKYKSHYKTIINWSLRDDRATTNTKSKAQRTESRRDFSGQESSFGKTLEV